MSAILRINEDPVRVCAQCKHYEDTIRKPFCAKSVDLVTGEMRLCADMRGIAHKDHTDMQPALCGLKGDLWEPMP